MAIGILVVLSGDDSNDSQNVAIPGKKYPEKTPVNIARNIQRVRYLSRNFSFGFIQQQFDFEPEFEHPQVGSEFDRTPFMIAVAQPTPALTVIACTGQFSSQAPHSIQ